MISIVAAMSSFVLAQNPVLTDQLRRVVPTGVASDFRSAAGDVDGDGDIDIASGARILLNDGNGVLTTSSCPPQPTYATRGATALADLDGDGDLDLVRRAYLDDEIELWLNSGNGCFTPVPGAFPVCCGYSENFDVGDVNGDGTLDLFVPQHFDIDQFDPKLFLNTGAATFVDASQLVANLGIHDHVDVDLADIDGDGDVDAFAYGDQSKPDCCGGGQQVPNRILLSNGAGGFTVLAGSLPFPLLYSHPILVDIDADGDLDAWADGSVLFANDGTAHFVDVSGNLPDVGEHPNLVVAGDLDGDGDIDGLIGGERDTRTLLNDGLGHFTALNGNWPGALGVGLFADLDGDLDLDLFHGDGVLFNRGAGGFVAPPVTLPPIKSSVFGVAMADVDGDRDLELMLAGSQSNRLFENQGNGAFVEMLGSLSAAGFNTGVAFADFDGDGDQDLVRSAYQEPLHVFLNDGAGQFATQVAALGIGSYDARWLVVGDLDGDHDIDVIDGDYQPSIWLNDGSGLLAQATGHWPSAYVGKRINVGDLDGDADLDAVAGYAPDGVSVLFNDGTGVFSLDNVALPGSGAGLIRPLLADLDGDADLDLVASRYDYYNGATYLALNDGLGHFTTSTQQLPPIAASSQAHALIDFDRDGDIDMLVAHVHEFLLLINDSAGHFSDAGVIAVGIESVQSDSLFADFDFDDDIDAVAGSPPAVLINITRQLTWRTPPRIGHRLELELHGPPSQAFKLYGSLGQTHVPFGALGTLLIDRSRIVVAAGGVFDGSGTALVARDIPADLALAGLTIYWQALTSNPRRLTNLELVLLQNY